MIRMIIPFFSGESLLWMRESPRLPCHMGGKRTESPCPLEPTQTAEILEEQSCIWLISPTKTRLCGCGTAACDHLICNSLWLSCNWGSLSAQPLHSQQPGINKRRRFPRASSSGISVSTAHTFIKFCLSIYLQYFILFLYYRPHSSPIPYIPHMSSTHRFIENNQIKSISPNAFRGLKTLIHLWVCYQTAKVNVKGTFSLLSPWRRDRSPCSQYGERVVIGLALQQTDHRFDSLASDELSVWTLHWFSKVVNSKWSTYMWSSTAVVNCPGCICPRPDGIGTMDGWTFPYCLRK